MSPPYSPFGTLLYSLHILPRSLPIHIFHFFYLLPRSLPIHILPFLSFPISSSSALPHLPSSPLLSPPISFLPSFSLALSLSIFSLSFPFLLLPPSTFHPFISFRIFLCYLLLSPSLPPPLSLSPYSHFPFFSISSSLSSYLYSSLSFPFLLPLPFQTFRPLLCYLLSPSFSPSPSLSPYSYSPLSFLFLLLPPSTFHPFTSLMISLISFVFLLLSSSSSLTLSLFTFSLFSISSSLSSYSYSSLSFPFLHSSTFSLPSFHLLPNLPLLSPPLSFPPSSSLAFSLFTFSFFSISSSLSFPFLHSSPSSLPSFHSPSNPLCYSSSFFPPSLFSSLPIHISFFHLFFLAPLPFLFLCPSIPSFLPNPPLLSPPLSFPPSSSLALSLFTFSPFFYLLSPLSSITFSYSHFPFLLHFFFLCPSKPSILSFVISSSLLPSSSL
ncbi:hypothetical protein C7M84_006812 [Penaeus vannamei]|uniref:Uncharacterized protein n=1 Tax=Penaeus vannamei TaxID=6689 RepID=A0A423TDY9_PENVA|nr:hypothetical protein C7M84_006812 [Penaeus vannamei]